MKIIIVDNRIPEKCKEALKKKGFYLLELPTDPDLGEAVKSHPDTVLFYADSEIITTADYCDRAAYIFSNIREFMPNVRISFTDERRSERYPRDCIMNALVIGKRIFCRSDSVSHGIKSFAERRGYEIVHTNQGYPSCSVLSFGNSAITADRGLASLLQKYGIKTTLIREGGISLPPHKYGFIGGAGGVVGDKIYFFGDIHTHPDCDNILRAINDEGYQAVSLSDEPLGDFGGIIAL